MVVSQAPAENCTHWYADYYDENNNLLAEVDLGITCDGGVPDGATSTEPGMPSPHSGGGGGSATTYDVVDSLTNNCFREVKNQLSTFSIAGSGAIGQIINQSFGFSNSWNLIFKNADTVRVNGQDVEGSTGASRDFINPNKINVTILLSNSALKNSSKEYIGAVIIHEIMHAFLRMQSLPASPDHETMAASYISKMSKALQDAYGISANDATALSWGGLNETIQGVAITSAWTTFKNNNPAQATQIQQINNDYQKGTKGTKC